MENLKKRFTRWYVRRGYRYGHTDYFEVYYICPVWVKPLLYFLFSPSVYIVEKWKTIPSELSAAAEDFARSFSEFVKAANTITGEEQHDH